MKKHRRTEQESERDDQSSETPAPPPEPQADGTPREPEAEAEPGDRKRELRSQGGTDTKPETDALRRELEEQRDQYLRKAAEFENYRKRTARELLDAKARAQAELAKQLVDALDDLGRVTSLDPATTDAAAVIDGVAMVERKLFKSLAAAGLEIINPLDQPFNPERHEAVATSPALSREDDGMVGEVYQQGYAFKGQLIRPARVVVKQWNG